MFEIDEIGFENSRATCSVPGSDQASGNDWVLQHLPEGRQGHRPEDPTRNGNIIIKPLNTQNSGLNHLMKGYSLVSRYTRWLATLTNARAQPQRVSNNA